MDKIEKALMQELELELAIRNRQEDIEAIKKEMQIQAAQYVDLIDEYKCELHWFRKSLRKLRRKRPG